VSIDFAARAAEVVTRRPGSAPIPPGAGAAALPALLASLDHQVIDAREEPEPLAAEIAAFVAAVQSGRELVPAAEEGLKAVTLAEEVAASMARAAAGAASA
jgi:predicted dehydrogenase